MLYLTSDSFPVCECYFPKPQFNDVHLCLPQSYPSVLSGSCHQQEVVASTALADSFPMLFRFYRYLWYLIRIAASLAYRPVPLPENPTYIAEEDVTIIVPTIDAGEEFKEAARSWLVGKPKEVIIVTEEKMLGPLQELANSVDPQRIRGVLAGDVITRPHKKTSDTRGSWNDSLGYMNVMLSVRRFALRNLYSAFTSVIRPVDARGDDVVRLTHHRRSRILGARLPKENRAGRRSGNLRQNTSRRLPSDRRTRHRPRRCRKRPFGNSLALDGAFQVLPFVRPVLFFGLYTYLSHPPDRRNGVAVLLPASCEYGTTFE